MFRLRAIPILAFVFSFLTLFSPGVFAQEGEKVSAVEVEGNKIVSTATI
ncbi:MAG: hypothetical protein HYZ88_02840, partial [Candidatus Omnitrophica bacterium]|nr:hypothetical protein [Candidatus Omnitrophota bacterium]